MFRGIPGTWLPCSSPKSRAQHAGQLTWAHSTQHTPGPRGTSLLQMRGPAALDLECQSLRSSPSRTLGAQQLSPREAWHCHSSPITLTYVRVSASPYSQPLARHPAPSRCSISARFRHRCPDTAYAMEDASARYVSSLPSCPTFWGGSTA